MAKLTDRDALNATPATGDVLHIVDVSDTTDDAAGTSKQITVANLINFVTNVTGFFNKSTETLDNLTEGTTNKHYTAAEQTKLAAIEAAADVTDTTNVTAAGALMDSEVTNLAAVKAFDPTAYATAAQGATADTALQPTDIASSTITARTGAINFSGGIDGDVMTVQADGSLAPEAPAASAVEGTAVLSTGEVGGTKFLREDGDGTSSWQAIPGGGDALTSSPLSQFAATTSAQLAGVLSDETGSGAAVFATSPTLVTPNLGTPSVLVGTNITGTAAGLTVGATTGVEAGADVTDTTNVTAAGALMDSECTDLASVKALNQGVATTDSPTFAKVTTPSIKGTLTTDTDAATITFDKNVSDFHNVVLGGNRTLALSNMAAGDRIVLRLTQDATGTRTVTWFTTIKWADGGTAPTLTTTINKADIFGFLCTSTGNYDGFIIGQNI